MAEASYQLSDKLDDGAIFLVRGETYGEFSANIASVVEDEDFRNDINKFLTTVRGAKPATEQQAQATVQQAFPQAQPVQQPQQQYAQQQPAPWEQPTGAAMMTCAHGQRIARSGTSKNGGTWEAYFCPQKAPGCKPMGSDGKLWK